jgi:hypothetical protein
MKKIGQTIVLMMMVSCAFNPVRKIAANKYEATCSGDDDMKCQEHAWKACNGSYDTQKDDQTGKRTEIFNQGATMHARAVKDYKLVFSCADMDASGKAK